MTTFPHLSAALPQLATPAEVADYLRRSEATVVRDCRAGRLPALKIGHRWLINVDRLAATLTQVSPSNRPDLRAEGDDSRGGGSADVSFATAPSPDRSDDDATPPAAVVPGGRAVRKRAS